MIHDMPIRFIILYQERVYLIGAEMSNTNYRDHNKQEKKNRHGGIAIMTKAQL